MNLENMEPIFHSEPMIAQLKKYQEQGIRMHTACSILNGFLSSPTQLDIYRSSAMEAFAKAQKVQTRIQAVKNGKPEPVGLTEEEGAFIKNTVYSAMVRDSYALADQMLAADIYVEPGSLLIIPLREKQEQNHENDDQTS